MLIHVMFLMFESGDKKQLVRPLFEESVENYIHGVPFIMLYKLVLAFESVDEILTCDHSNVSY